MDPITLIGGAVSLASKFAPYLIKKLRGDKAADTAEEVFSIAKAVTGFEEPDKAIKMIESDPETALKFKEAIMNYESMVIQEDTRRLEIANQTMRTEYETTGWKTGWRPYWGYLSGTMFGVQMLAFSYIGIYAIMKTPKEAIEVINAIATLAAALSTTWLLALSVLGLAVHKRSKDKQTAAGIQPVSILKTILSNILK